MFFVDVGIDDLFDKIKFDFVSSSSRLPLTFVHIFGAPFS
jgi:hypothetical protein